MRVYYSWAWNTRETVHGMQRSWTHFVCVCFPMCGRQKLEYPNWSSMNDDAITRGGIGVLGSPFYIICVFTTKCCCSLTMRMEHKLKLGTNLVYGTVFCKCTGNMYDSHTYSRFLCFQSRNFLKKITLFSGPYEYDPLALTPLSTIDAVSVISEYP